MSNQSIKIERLPDAELDVMLVLWSEKRPLKTAEIFEVLSQKKSWTPSTLQALLARLEQRGFVTMKKEGRLKLYSPLVEEESYRSQETSTFLERLHGNSVKSLFAALIDGKKLKPSDLDEIAQMLKDDQKEE